MSVDEYPILSRSGPGSQVRGKLGVYDALVKTMLDGEAFITSKVNKATSFWTNYFGLKPMERIVNSYFYDAEGKSLNIEPGSAVIGQHVTEIMKWGTAGGQWGEGYPSAEKSGLSYADVQVVFTAVAKWVKNKEELNSLGAEIEELALNTLLGMNIPTPETVHFLLDRKTFTANDVRRRTTAHKPPHHAEHVQSFSESYKGTAFTTNLMLMPFMRAIREPGDLNTPYANAEKVAERFRLKVEGERLSPSGPIAYAHIGKTIPGTKTFAYMSPFASFYSLAFADKSPKKFWLVHASHRIAAFTRDNGTTSVRLVRVNPETGAGTNLGAEIGTSTSTPTMAIGEIRKLYPYILPLSPGDNPTVNFTPNDYYSRTDLAKEAESWRLTPNKQARRFVQVVDHSWNWSDEELAKNPYYQYTFSRGSSKDGGLLVFHTDRGLFKNGKPKVGMSGASGYEPPSEMKKLVYGPTTGLQNVNEVYKAQFIITSEGAQQAIEKIGETSTNNPIAKHFSDRLNSRRVDAQGNYANVTNMTLDEFNQVMEQFRREVILLDAVLKSARIHQVPFSQLLQGESISNFGLPSPYSKTYDPKKGVKAILTNARWPSMAGSVAYEVGVNDKRDMEVTRTRFVKALTAPNDLPPTELSLPEMPNMRIAFAPMIGPNGRQMVTWELQQRRGFPFDAAKSSPKGAYQFFSKTVNHRSIWHTRFTSRYSMHARGVVSGARSNPGSSVGLMQVDAGPVNQFVVEENQEMGKAATGAALVLTAVGVASMFL